MRRAAFLDRDGVINRKAREGEYVTRWEEVEILPGVAEAIALLNQAGLCAVVVSNQRCVAKGLITSFELEALHSRMREALASAGGTIDALYYCPHDTEPPCGCRKPQPGMLFDAARDHGIDLSSSWMIGDSQADVEAGQKAGCKTVLIGDDGGKLKADVVSPSLLDAVHQILHDDEVSARQRAGFRGTDEQSGGLRNEEQSARSGPSNMIFAETKLPGVFEIRIDPRNDERGFFARSWCAKEFAAHGLNPRLAQCNISFNARKGTLRGVHFQDAPYPEAKLVHCTQGGIYDVAVDLRPQSPTFKRWVAAVLTAENRHMLYIPEGCAHGLLTLTDNAEVFYQMSEFYHPELARGVRFDDPAFEIVWPEKIEVISERDRSYPNFEACQ